MNEENKNRLKEYFDRLMKKLKDGVIHEIPVKDVSEAKEGDADEI